MSTATAGGCENWTAEWRQESLAALATLPPLQLSHNFLCSLVPGYVMSPIKDYMFFETGIAWLLYICLAFPIAGVLVQ